MERIITSFVAALREKGIRVSPGEVLDAVHALALGGVSGRETVRALLRLTLVKNSHEFETFDEVFDCFFTSGQCRVPGIDPDDLLGALIHIVEGEELKADLSEQHPGEEGPKILVDEEVTADDLENLVGLEESEDDSEGAELQVQLDGYRGKKEASKPSEFHTQNMPTMAYNPGVANKREDAFTPEELADMQEVVSRMIVRLRKDVRRMKERQSRGKLHVMRTIQHNYRHGMVPFLLSLRRKLKEKPRLVVLCDVSYSVSHASRFMLLLLHTLHNRLMDVRSFIFNKEVAEITEQLRNMPVNALLETIDEGDIVDLDDNSDYGHVFLTFKQKHLENMRGKPAVIILGDARNNFQEPNDWALEEIAEKAGYMLWLNPEERDLWSRGDSLIELYGSYCDRVEVVQNVDELSLMVEDLFRAVYVDEAPRSTRDRLKNKPDKDGEEDEELTYYYKQPKAPKTPRWTEFGPSSKEWRERFGLSLPKKLR